MVLKGAVQPNHIPVNNYELQVEGLGVTVLFTSIGGLEEELETATMPDRTVVSGGNVKATESDFVMFEHHAAELAAMRGWFAEAKRGDPNHKKVGTLIKRAIDGSVATTRALSGMFPKKQAGSDLELDNEGEPAMVTWTMSIDAINDV